MELIDKYEVSEEKQESLNEITSRCNAYMIKEANQNHDICFNEVYNLNFKFNKIK